MPYFALLLNDAKLEREHKRQQDRKSQFSISFPSFDSRCSRRTMSIGFWKFKHLHLLPQEDLLQNHFPLHKKQAGLTQNHSSYCMGILSENCLIQLFQKKSPQIRAPILLLSCSKISSLLGIQGVKTSPYHPQTDGLVEIFSKTLKSMVRKVVNETQADWDQ